jgi:hypothetical protein
VSRAGSSTVHLRTAGEQRWLSAGEAEALRDELLNMGAASDLSAEDRLTLAQAVELVDYEIANRTGVAVVPPANPESPTANMLVATERLGWPLPSQGWRRWLPWETQRRIVYDDRPEEPSATCHLQKQDRERALCGYPWERLIVVPGSPKWTDLHPDIRCRMCSEIAGSRTEEPTVR